MLLIGAVGGAVDRCCRQAKLIGSVGGAFHLKQRYGFARVARIPIYLLVVPKGCHWRLVVPSEGAQANALNPSKYV